MHQLKNSLLPSLQSKGLNVPEYRMGANAPKTGIVHLGPGAFFRAHQAWYTDRAMSVAGGDWGITAVSMRSPGVSQALTEQDGLYCLAELDVQTSFQVIGSINEVLIAKEQYANVLERLSAANTKIVTLTITEKGYCLNSQGKLDLTNSGIINDIKGDSQCVTAVGILVEALGTRMRAGLSSLCIISCDNITDNGSKLKAALIRFAQQTDPQLAKWLETELVCPGTMVDSITPATDDSLRNAISTELEIKDNWPIKRESFVQWVIEDCLPDPKPAWQQAGVIFTKDVHGFEKAKLRLLNCPHSSIAYLGVLLGIETVFDAMQQTEIVGYIRKMINDEIIPSVSAPKEMDVQEYSEDILKRFCNPAIRHLLDQIAWDGSQKLPMRILPIVEQNMREQRSIALVSRAIASWFLFVRKRYIDNTELVDPLAVLLLSKASQCNDQAEHDVMLFLSVTEVFSNELASSAEFIAELCTSYRRLLPLVSNPNFDWSV